MANTRPSFEMEEDFVDKFNNDPLYRNKINNLLGGDYDYAEDCKSGLLTEQWRNLSGKKGNDRSKSDVTLSGSSGIIGISIKNGGGRATSANYSETKAIFYTVLKQSPKYTNDKVLNRLINELFDKWEPFSKQCFTEYEVTTTKVKSGEIKHPELQQYINLCGPLSDILREIFAHSEEYMIDIISESLTGFNKFGEDFARADYYLKFGKGGLNDIQKLLSVNDAAFNEVCRTYLKGKKLNINMKRGSSSKKGTPHWIRFM